MSNLPISSKYRSRPNDPVSEDERNQLSAQLNDTFTQGTVDQDTYDRLLGQIFDAQRLGELVEVVETIGKPATHDTPAIVDQAPKGQPGQLSEIKRPNSALTLGVVGGVTGGIILIVLILVLVMVF